jgi:hypothetical protein
MYEYNIQTSTYHLAKVEVEQIMCTKIQKEKSTHKYFPGCG